MVALEVWYDVDSDEATFVQTHEELDAVLEHAMSWGRPVIVQLLIADDLMRAVIDLGFDRTRDRGVIYFAGDEAPDGVSTQGSESVDPSPIYYYMTSDTEFPATAEIPLAAVRKAAHEYMDTGGARPSGLTWQPMYP